LNQISRKVRVEGIKLAGEEWNRKGSFINKPSQGWLHTDDKILGSGVSYIVRYMGCIEVLKSMRSLDFYTRTQVTRKQEQQMTFTQRLSHRQDVPRRRTVRDLDPRIGGWDQEG
uniref:SHC (Src homology 2 domain containing) transforming protein 2 n=1 Tax=Callorhinchus milii TaxID=7868 RepID=A0A4W3H8Q7_CALMI